MTTQPFTQSEHAALGVRIAELVEALAASEARERTLRAMIADLPGQLMNLAIDLETGKTKAAVSRGLRDVAKRFYQAPLPDAPSPEK